MTTPTPLTEEQMAQAKAEITAAKVAFVQELMADLDAVRVKIASADPELYFGGLPQSVTSARNMLEVQRNEMARAHGLPTVAPNLN